LPVVGLTFALAVTAVWNAFLAFELFTLIRSLF
jgi:hypothetical protein